MLPHRFQYHRPQQLEGAFDLLDRHGEEASVYAGGTELLLALKARVLRYAHLVDLKRIPALKGVHKVGGEIVIGALSTHFALAADPVLQHHIPAYAELSNGIANIRVRVAGTIGGNLCFGEPHADPPPLLAALGASLTLRSAQGERSVAMSDFIEGEFTTVREPGEILTEIRVPIPAVGARFAYRSFGHLERPAVGIAAAYVPDDRAAPYRLWAGAIADRPIHLQSLERALERVPPSHLGDVLAPAVTTAAQGLPAHDDLNGSADYKRHLAAVLMRRAIEQAAGAPTPGRQGAHGHA